MFPSRCRGRQLDLGNRGVLRAGYRRHMHESWRIGVKAWDAGNPRLCGKCREKGETCAKACRSCDRRNRTGGTYHGGILSYENESSSVHNPVLCSSIFQLRNTSSWSLKSQKALYGPNQTLGIPAGRPGSRALLLRASEFARFLSVIAWIRQETRYKVALRSNLFALYSYA